jgi:hypothetical protein
MAKRPLNVLTLISAMMCVATAGVVGRSFVRMDVVHVPIGKSSSAEVQTIDGRFRAIYPTKIQRRLFRHFTYETAQYRRHVAGWAEKSSGLPKVGIAWARSASGAAIILLPLWLLALLTAILPLRWLLLGWARRRGGRGFAVVAEGGELDHRGAKAPRHAASE